MLDRSCGNADYKTWGLVGLCGRIYAREEHNTKEMLSAQWLSKCAAKVEIASEGRVHRLLFLADFVGTSNNEYQEYSSDCDLCLLCAPSITETSKHSVRTLALHSTVQMLSLAGVHHVESCQNQETVLISDSLCLVPYSVTPALTSWVVKIVGGANLLCFSCSSAGGKLPQAKHHLIAESPPQLSAVVKGIVCVPQPYSLHLASIAHFPRSCVEHTLPPWCLHAIDLLGLPSSTAAGEGAVFCLEHEIGLFAGQQIVQDFFPVAVPSSQSQQQRVWFEGKREMDQITQAVGAFVKAKVEANGLIVTWGNGDNRVEVLGRNRFRIVCPQDLALAKRLAKHLCDYDVYSIVLYEPTSAHRHEAEQPVKRARIAAPVVEEGEVQQEDPQALLLDEIFANRQELLLSDIAQDGRVGDKKEVILLVKRLSHRYQIQVNSSNGKRMVKRL